MNRLPNHLGSARPARTRQRRGFLAPRRLRFRATRLAREEGIGVIDTIFVVPVLVAIALLIVGLGRVRIGSELVGGIAEDAARAASLQRTAAGAITAALTTVQSSLTASTTSCVGGPAVSVDTSRWQPGGSVAVTVTCTATLADLAAPGLPGSKTLTAHAVAPLETYRGVQR